jgi:hypothetical protein
MDSTKINVSFGALVTLDKVQGCVARHLEVDSPSS